MLFGVSLTGPERPGVPCQSFHSLRMSLLPSPPISSSLHSSLCPQNFPQRKHKAGSHLRSRGCVTVCPVTRTLGCGSGLWPLLYCQCQSLMVLLRVSRVSRVSRSPRSSGSAGPAPGLGHSTSPAPTDGEMLPWQLNTLDLGLGGVEDGQPPALQSTHPEPRHRCQLSRVHNRSPAHPWAVREVRDNFSHCTAAKGRWQLDS